MDVMSVATAQRCLSAAAHNTLSFPQIVGALIEAGFESYAIDFRRAVAVYYRPDGDSLELPSPLPHGSVGGVLDVEAVQAAIRQAQRGGPDYSYAGFCDKVTAAGCAGYLVSFPGRRAVYFGRTGETHVEAFPTAV
ncbi:MAG: DUF1398 domain-containing protein [Caulobacter sp.]|nr:DUF1398 domain-containing protein [Caulobacter sp.]